MAQNSTFPLEKIGIIFGIFAQIVVLIWAISSTTSTMEATIAQLKSLNEKLEERLDDLEDRLRMAEREIAILRTLMDRNE